MDYAVSHLWVKTKVGSWPCREVWRIGEWEVLLSGCCMGLFDHYFVLNSQTGS